MSEWRKIGRRLLAGEGTAQAVNGCRLSADLGTQNLTGADRKPSTDKPSTCSGPSHQLLRRLLIRDQHVHDLRLERGMDRVRLVGPTRDGDHARRLLQLFGSD